MNSQITSHQRQQVGASLSTIEYLEFEWFVFHVATSQWDGESEIHGEFGFDIHIRSSGRHIFVEAKRKNLVEVDALNQVLALREIALGDIDLPAEFVLAVAGSLSSAAKAIAERENIQVWDRQSLQRLAPDWLIERFLSDIPISTQKTCPSEPSAQALLDALRKCPTGRGHWSHYQKLVSEVLEYLFCPPLEPPSYESSTADKRLRRDMVFPNPADAGFWCRVKERYKADFIVADAKNYKAPLKKQPVLDIAHYLKPFGCGMFAILVSRKGAGAQAVHAISEQWIGSSRMIVSINDQDLIEMVELKVGGNDPSRLLDNLISAFRIGL